MLVGMSGDKRAHLLSDGAHVEEVVTPLDFSAVGLS